MIVQTWSTVLKSSMEGMWLGVAGFVPNLIFAIVILILGWIIGSLIEKLIEKIISAAKLDSALSAAGLREALNKAGFSLNSGKFIGALVKWFLIIVFLIASLEVLGLAQVNEFLRNAVLGYLPRVIAAVLIFLAATVIAEVVEKIVSGAARATNVSSANFLGSVAKWAIWTFAILMSLGQLGIDMTILNTLFMGVVIALALGFGLSFGLGGQEAAARLISKVGDKISTRR